MKLVAKKAGNGYVSSYTVNISLKLARNCGFVDENGNTKEIELVENIEENSITIKIKKQGE